MKKILLISLFIPLLFLVGCASNNNEETIDPLIGSESDLYEFNYQFNNELIVFSVEVVYNDEEFLFADINTITHMSELTQLHPQLDRLAFILEVVTPEQNERLCIEIVSEGEEKVAEEGYCRTTSDEFPAISLEDIDDFSDFMLLAIYQDTDQGFDYSYVNITLINETHYEDYQNKE